MSNPRLTSSGKPEICGSTIGFRFHAMGEELEEVQSKQGNLEDSESSENSKSKAVYSTPEIAYCTKAENDDSVPDAVRDHWNLLGRKPNSLDLNYESAFSNPIETWKKLSVLKEKITKTVEEKISEMKIDRGVLSKTSRGKLTHNKDNSSVSDSEDTSESSKMSEQWRDAECQISCLDSVINENPETCCSYITNLEVENIKEEGEKKESKNELRNRKSLPNFSELIHLPDVKIATAKSNIDGSLLVENFNEEVESGVEAAEHLESTDTDSVDAFDGSTSRSGGGSQTPSGGFFMRTLSYWTSIISSNSYFIMLLVTFILYFMFPLSDFIRGFLLSFSMAVLWAILKSYLRSNDTSLSQQKPFTIPDYRSMPPLKVPHYKSHKGVWINEYDNDLYDPDYYSVSQTTPAYLELDNNILKISKPKGRIRKRATFDEPEYKLQFISRRIYNISGCNVYLMPDGLTRKRLFSKKYPIVIFLRADSLISESKNGKEIEEKDICENGEAEETACTPISSPKTKSTLYLFARCDRQKQEWYRRLLAATRLSDSPVAKKNGKIPEVAEDTENSDESPSKDASTPFENLFFDDEIAMLDEYLRYMAKFVDIVYRILLQQFFSNDPRSEFLRSKDGKGGLFPDIFINPPTTFFEEIIRHEIKVKPHSSWYRKLKTKKKDVPDQEDEENRVSVKCNYVYKRGKASPSGLPVEENEDKKPEELYQPSLQIQWFNAFINRILFDVFRSPYWLSKIHDKLQRKLNSIRLPYYVEDIEVVEMDLGKTGPIFHRVSQPCIDELGLWFDMDATFDGLIRLTVQTHLNLVKLQKGIEENEVGHLAEKLKKEKKKQKEAKDPFLVKDSKVKSKNKKMSKPDSKGSVNERNHVEPPPCQPCHGLECKSCEDCTKKLIDEVAQFAEIAVEESFAGSKEKGSKSTLDNSTPELSQQLRSPIYDSDLEDSAESSDEDEDEEGNSTPRPQETEDQSCSAPTSKRYPRDRRSSKRIFKVFENVAQSKYFRSVAQSKYIQKAIAGVSAARLRLTLEIKSCTGTLAINVPPPPSDRFWYGFREMPKLVFSANPKIGDKSLRFAHIRNYLQKKILHELKKVMVTPNMIDFVLPTSVEGRGSSSPQFDDPDLQEATP